MNKITHAYYFAENAHKNQKRKYTNEPYIIHPLSVMNIVEEVTFDEDMLIASLLHDVVEDTDYIIEDIENVFGFDVAELVDGLTDISLPEDGNRAKRKEIDRNHVVHGCYKVQTIKLADIIDNTFSIVKQDKNFAKVYMKEKKLLLEVLTKGDIKLFDIANKIVENYYKGIK